MKSFLTDQEFRHQVAYDNPFIPYKLETIQVENGHPDILFHWHTEMEVHYIQEGTARYHIDNDYFNSRAGDIVLIRPNAMHSVHPIGQEPHRLDSFLCHLDMVASSSLDKTTVSHIQPLQTDAVKFTPCLRQGDAGYEEIAACIRRIIQTTKEKGRHFELLLKSQITQLIYLLYHHRHVHRKHTDDAYRKNEKIREVIDHIHHHYGEELTLESLATSVGYSKSHFMAVFKQHTGVTCTDFITHFRLHRAKEELAQSQKTILNIADHCGFNNLSNFNRQFKAYYRTTPSQYRKSLKKTNPS